MRSVSVRLEDLKTMILNLGFAGENEHTRVTVDCKKMYDQYPSASASLTVQPPEGEAYPAIIERDGDYVIWDVTDSDLVAEGSGEMQLSFTQEPHLAKSYTGRFKVGRSLLPTGSAPAGIDDFLTRAGAAVTAIPETINSALAAAKASGEFDGPQGPAGQDGADGQDGFSPVVAVSAITGGHQVSVTDAEGTETFDVMDGVDGVDGQDGAPGQDGVDGVTPEISIGTVTSGSTPAASMDNTDPAHPVLSLTLQKGDKGDTGDAAPAEQVVPAVNAYLASVITNPDSPPLDRTLSAAQAAAPADMVGDLKSAITQHEPAYLTVASDNITEKTSYFISGSVGNTASETANVLWNIMSMTVSAGQKYRVSAQFYSAITGVYFLDDSNKIIEKQGSESSDTLHTLDVTVPANAVKMSINDKKSAGFSVKSIITPVINDDRIIIGNTPISELLHDVIGQLVGVNKYSIGTGKMKNVVSLYGSQNGTVKYESLLYDNASFKTVTDDISPVQIDAGYVGANHGYNLVYEAVKSSHGLTESDIGKTCTIDGETWVLIKIKSATTFVVGCLDGESAYGLKPVTTPPTTFNFGTSITVTSISRQQLRPSVNNINIAVVNNTDKVFEIAESYDIIDLASGVDYIIDNVGTNTNNTIVEKAGPAITIRNLYTFFANGACVVTHNYKAIKDTITIAYWGGTQSESFTNNGDYFSVPMTENGTLSAAGQYVTFGRSTWDDSTKPPIVYCQTNAAPNNATKMMVQGVLMDNRNAALYSAAGFIYTTSKMYPYSIQPAVAPATNTTYNFVTFRLPIYAAEMNDNFTFCQWCKVRNDYYFFCFSKGAASDSIIVPAELCGRKIETVMAENASVLNELVAKVIDVVATGESYLLLKLTN